jgi:flagellar hook-basal body complex protein FliE
MSQMEIDRVLATIRSFSAQNAGGVGGAGGLGGLGQAGAPGAAGGTNGVSEFSKLLQKGIDSVNQAQNNASTLATQFERGVPGVELPQVMLEMQKASVSFRALTEVRNRLVNAYQEIMNMPL